MSVVAGISIVLVIALVLCVVGAFHSTRRCRCVSLASSSLWVLQVDRIHCLHLKHRLDRLDHIQEHMRKHCPQLPLELVEGQPGPQAPPHPLVHEDGWAELQRVQNGEDIEGWRLTPGAIGCALGHRKMWEKCVATQTPLLIIEDDTLCTVPKLWDAVEQLALHFPLQLARATLVYLGYGTQSGAYPLPQWQTLPSPGSPAMGVPSHINGLFGYLLHPEGAAALLRHCFPLRFQLDTEMWRAFGQKGVRPLACKPTLVSTLATPSDVQTVEPHP